MGNLALYENRIAPKVMIYGDGGTGKTTLAAALSKYFNIIVLDMDNSLETYQKLPADQQERVTYIGIRDDWEKPKGFLTVDKILMAKAKTPVKYCLEHGRIDCLECLRSGKKAETIDLDKFSPSNTIIIIDSRTRYSDSHFADATKNVDFETIGEKAAYDHWGSLRQRMLNFDSLVQYNKFPICVIAHTEFVESKEGNRFYPSGGSRKTASGSAKFYNAVVYMKKVNGKIVATTSPTGDMQAIARSRADIEVSMDNIETFIDLFRPMSERKVFTKEVIDKIVKDRESANQVKAVPPLTKK